MIDYTSKPYLSVQMAPLVLVAQEEAFGLSEDVSQAYTIWSTVYDLQTGLVNVAISRGFSRWYQVHIP